MRLSDCMLFLLSNLSTGLFNRRTSMRALLIDQTDRLREKVSQMARQADGALTDFARDAARMKAGIADAIEDRMTTARRAVKHGYRATEDIVDGATHRIKRDPWRAVGLSLIAGTAVGWLLSHRPRA
jgi:ElaB/YqjD/DUF883 family membrane-anchored ribosome-binding protein